jgi:hypothetical protein
MGRHLEILRRYIDDLGLVNRDSTAMSVRTMIDQGLIGEDQAQGIYLGLQPLGDEVQRRRNYLSRPPELDEIYPDGMPDLIIGELVENPEVPVGFFLHDNIHTIFAGNSGSGTTTAMYNLVLAVDKRNREHPDDFTSFVFWVTKDAAPLAIADVVRNCMIVNARTTLRVTLEPPAGVPDGIWNNELGQLIGHRGGLQYGGISLTDMLVFLGLKMLELPSDQGRLYPTFENLYELSTIAPKGVFESKEQYQQSVNQVLRQLARGTGDLFKAARGGLDLERDVVAAKKHLIIDARGLSPKWVRALTSDILLKRLLLGRQLSEESHRGRCLILWDEASEDVSRKAEEQYE